MALLIALVRSWTGLYSLGLPASLRDDRRAEIASDLWEHQRLADLEAAPVLVTALEIFVRFVTGMPADFVWRLESGAIVRSEKRSLNVSTNSRAIRVLTVAAFVVVIGLIGFAGIDIAIRGWQDDTNVGWILTGAIPFCIAVPAILGGLLYASSHPVRGIALVAAGVLVTTIVWFWFFMISIPLGAGLIALAYHRAKRSGWGTEVSPA